MRVTTALPSGAAATSAEVAAARELIEMVYYALRDGTARRLAAPA